MSEMKMVAAMLAARYAVRAVLVVPVAEGTETSNTRVQLAGGGRVFAKRYPVGADIVAVRSSLAFADYCADHGVPTPALWVDEDGEFLTGYGGAAWCVMDETPGQPAFAPLTARQAETIGTGLGRLHRLAAAYRGPLRPADAAWRDADSAAAAARCDALLENLRTAEGWLASSRREHLEQRRNDLLTYSSPLRRDLPRSWSEQPLHGDATRPNLLLGQRGEVTFIDFRAVRGPTVWELAKVAFDPLTVAHSDGWIDTAVATISAYVQENPGVEAAELVATARVALLYRMFSTYGAVVDDYLPAEAASALNRYWDDKHVTVARLQRTSATSRNDCGT